MSAPFGYALTPVQVCGLLAMTGTEPFLCPVELSQLPELPAATAGDPSLHIACMFQHSPDS